MMHRSAPQNLSQHAPVCSSPFLVARLCLSVFVSVCVCTGSILWLSCSRVCLHFFFLVLFCGSSVLSFLWFHWPSDRPRTRRSQYVHFFWSFFVLFCSRIHTHTQTEQDGGKKKIDDSTIIIPRA